MTVPTPAPARDALLRAALLGAAGADLLFAAAILFDWQRVLSLLALPLPASPVYVQLAALMAAGLALAFLYAGIAPLRSRAIIGVAAIVRGADAVLLSTFVARRLLPGWGAALAAAEAVLAMLHAVYWLRLRRNGRKE